MGIGRPANDLSDFWRYVQKGEGCWPWIGTVSKTRGGYGVFHLNLRQIGAHRVAYELVKGPIPEGLEIDHLCRNPVCVNPDHLEAVTGRVNTLRSTTISAVNARKVDCKRGHPLSGDNLYRKPDDSRHCRACQRLRDRERRSV